jgi:hypothetical protein
MWPLRPLGVLIVLGAALSVAQVVYVTAGVPMSAAASGLTSYSLALFAILWVVADARGRRRVPCYDFGMLVAVYFPLSLVWYVFWSRGRRGALLLAALVGLMSLPWLSAVVAWLLLYGRA